jgi:hypothetical protein
MFKKLTLSLAWFFVSIGSLLSAVGGWYVIYLWQPSLTTQVTTEPVVAAPQENAVVYNMGQVKGVTSAVETADSRPELISSFLERYNSPLKPYDYFGTFLVKTADQYEIDFRLLPAIAMQESNLCKAAPEGTHNCLGFGIHSKGTLGFPSYEAAFERAARELKKNYIDKGLVTPEQIMTKYTPSSNGSWANSVNQWMAEMRYNDRTKGKTQKTDADLLEFVDTDQEASSSAVAPSPSL